MSWGRQVSLYRSPDWAGIAHIAVAAVSAQSSAIAADGDYELSADTDCYVLVGANPTAAAATSRFVGAGRSMTLRLRAGDKIAAIRKTADGNLSILQVA